MRHAAKAIADIPIRRFARALHSRTSLHVVSAHISAATSYVGADDCARGCSADGGDVLAATSADLMSEHTANDRTGDRTGHIRCVTAFFDHLLSFDPAALFRWAHDRTHGR